MNQPALWSGLGLVAPLQARVSGRLPPGVTGVSIDTRTLQTGDLFFAIKGDTQDGHDHVATAFDKGAAAAVVDEAHADAFGGSPCLFIVNDVLHALEGLGQAARARSDARIVAVTGSVGKTTTKDALRLVLSEAGPTHGSAASYNNHWGVPLTLARLPAGSRYGVFEIGMNHAGEITPLVAMVRPHVAIVTTVAPVHLEYFAGVDEIADAKAEIFSGIVEGGAAIIHRDIETFDRLKAAAEASPAAHVLSFGEQETADAHAERIDLFADGSLVSARILGKRIDFRVGAPGKHLVINALAVLLAAGACGIDLNAAARTLFRLTAGPGRGAKTILQAPDGDFTLIDESYNANPTSVRAALALLGSTPPGRGGRRIAVLGDMLELGPDAAAMHASLSEDVLRNGVDLLFAAGTLSHDLFTAVPAKAQGLWGPTAVSIEDPLAETIRAGDVVMVKGSNGSRMGPLVAALKQRFASPQPAP